MPLLHEDATPDISGDPNPGRALTRKESTQAQKQQAQMLAPPVIPSPERPPSPQSDGAQVDKQQDQPQQPAQAEQKSAAGNGQAQLAAQGTPQAASQIQFTPEEQAHFTKIAQNPWLGGIDLANMPSEIAWNVARHVGAGWNALVDPNAMSAAQHDIWSRNDAAAKLIQLVEAGYQGQQNPAQAEWFWSHFGSAVLTAPAYFNPLSGTALLGLSLAGQGPEKPQQVPGALAGGLPLAELGTVAKHPEAIKDPEVASRLFWKSANAALLGVAVLPMTRWLKGLALIKPEVLQEIEQNSARMRALQPGDPGALPDGEVLKQALNLPPMADETLVARAPKRDIRQMELSPSGEYSDLTAKQRARVFQSLGATGAEDLPHVAPDWTPAQVKLARKVLPQWLPYDLTRKYAADVPPQNPYDFLEQTAEAGPAAMRYLAAFNHTLLQVRRGPVLDPMNAAESMVHSIPAMHTGTRLVVDEYFHAAEAALMEQAGLDDRQLMRAIRDPAAYDALSPAGKMIVNAQKIIRREYAEQARDFGHREGFVPNYDPRVEIQEEAPIKGATKGGIRIGGKSLTGESKASRQERFIVHPEDPSRVALAEAHPDVFALNAKMKELRQSFIASESKTGARRDLEAKAANRRDDWYGAMKAQEELDRWDAQGLEKPSAEKVAEVTQRAVRRYPLFHEGLHEASVRSLGRQIMALHSSIALPQVLNALAHDGNRLAFAKTEREIPAGYKSLVNASRAFDGYVFHPDFANPLNRIASSAETHGVYDAWVKTNELSVAALMFSPMIHGSNIVDRAAWLLGKHLLGPEAAQAAQQTASAIAHTKPWSRMEQVFGVKHGSEMERIKWQMGKELEAVNAGVIPHFPSKGLSNLLFSQYGKAMGDATAFEGPGTRETWRLPPAFHGIEGAARQVGHGYEGLQNFLWGQIVWPFGVMAYHVERAAIKAARPDLPELALDQYAAHMANRWQGAIEPMARSQAMNTIWRATGFAINWVRSFYELALPSYLSKSAVAAHPELKGYILRQELQTLVGMMAAQHVSGNLMNLLLSGHPQWENDPHNRYYLEITRPEVIRGLQALGLYKNVDAATGRDPETGGRLVMENPMARQQLQMERMLGLEPGTSPMQGAQDMLAGHLAPLVDTMAAAFNVNLPQSILSGTPRYVDQSQPKPEPPWQANFWALLAQFGGVGSSIGRQVQLDASGRPLAPDETMPEWLKNAPVPEAVKRYAAPSAQVAWNWMTGIRAPYVRAEKTEGIPIPDQNYAAYADLSAKYKQDMTDWSNQLMTGKITPYEWRQQYSARAHDYAIRLDQLFSGAPEYKNGSLGLYAGYQKLYNEAQLADGTGIDWGKLDGLQADYMQHLTSSQQSDLQTQIAKHENAYPALGMYRSTIDSHTQFAKDYAQSVQVSYGALMAEAQQAQGLDRVGRRQFEAQHPELGGYYQAQMQWEINTWPGRLYSLYYHTAALSRWLIPTQGESGDQAEEEALKTIEQHYTAPATGA